MGKKDKEKPPISDNLAKFGDKVAAGNFATNPKNAGRKPNPAAEFAKKYELIEVTPKIIMQFIQALVGAPMYILREMVADKDAPQIMRLLAQEFINAEEGEAKERALALKLITDFIDRIAGKAPQHITVTNEDNNNIDLSALTEEEVVLWGALMTKLSQSK